MRLTTIQDLNKTIIDFYRLIINPDNTITWQQFLDNCNNYANEITMHEDDTCDVDFGSMCFTVYKQPDNTARLCENASYYLPMRHPDSLDEEEINVIDVELF